MEVKGLVAKTILHQLGGPARLRVMVGARDFVLGTDYLQFALPTNLSRNKINLIRIRLTADDLYDVTFSYYRAGKMQQRVNVPMVDESALLKLLEQETGLYFRLPTLDKPKDMG